MEIISNVALITINETLFIQVISFLIFMYILNRIMVQPLKETMNERDAYLSGIKREIHDAEEEVETIARQLRRRERKVRNEAADFARELEIAGGKEADQVIAEAVKQITDLNHETSAEITAAITEARKSVKAESEILALAAIEKVLNRRLN